MSIWKKLIIVLVAGIGLSGCSLLEKKNVAGLQVMTNEAISSLFLDGQYLDKTPYINKTIQPGTYTLKIQPDSNQLVAYETQITLRRGTLTVVTWKPGPTSAESGGIVYDLEPISGKRGEISFLTIPDNAIITFDQGEQQFSPLVIRDIEPGHHQLEISLPAYEKQQHTLNVIGGYRINVSAQLARNSQSDQAQIKNGEQTDPSPTKERTDLLLNTTNTSSISGQMLSATQSARFNPQLATQSGQTGQENVVIKSTNFFYQNQEALKVRSNPNGSSQIVGYATVGKSYPYLGLQQAGWLKIQLDVNTTGWVSQDYVQKN